MKERIQELKMKTSMWCDENIPEQLSYESGYGETWENTFTELLIKFKTAKTSGHIIEYASS